MLNIYLARHGQNEDNANGILNGHRDMPLTALGVEQAKNLAIKIKTAGIKFAAIYSSPLQRVYKTAEIITKELNTVKPEIMPELIERDFGIMTGKNVSEIESLIKQTMDNVETITSEINKLNNSKGNCFVRSVGLLSVISVLHSNSIESCLSASLINDNL